MPSPGTRRPETATSTVPARAGLVGNPSDGFGGAVVAVPVPVGAATVRVEPSSELEIVRSTGGTSAFDAPTSRWSSVDEFRREVSRFGFAGDDRIIAAALAALLDHVGRRVSPDGGVRITWGTDVPESVGLAGSSALAVATIEAVSRAWFRPLAPDVVAALALSAEVDQLGIAAGWQDRVVQARARPVLVDTERLVTVDGVGVPMVRELRVGAPLDLVVGWRRSGSESSARYHRDLRSIPSAEVDAAMDELADLARSAAEALEAGDSDELARLLDRGWLVRQRVLPLRADHTELVEAARAAGAAATTPGSGGSVVALATGPDHAAELVERLGSIGAESAAFSLERH